MSYLKRRVAIFLCMVMAFTTIFCVMPQEQVQAASKVQFSWMFGGYSSNVKEAQIELGAENLYIGDYVSAYNNGSTYVNYGYLSSNSGVTYKSSNKNVIDVDKNGKLTVKKTGTATITVKFKGNTGKCKLTVVESLESIRAKVSAYETGKTVSEKLVSAYGTGITNKNRYNVLKAYDDYRKSYASAVYSEYSGTKTTYYIFNPIAGRAGVIASAVYKYGEERNPLASTNGKYFKIKSITGKGTNITINLKSKVTEEQIVGLQFGNFSYDDKVTIKKTSTVKFTVYVGKNKKYDYKNAVKATATVKKGSNKITIKTSKLKKGQNYYLFGGAGWLDPGANKNSFKAK